MWAAHRGTRLLRRAGGGEGVAHAAGSERWVEYVNGATADASQIPPDWCVELRSRGRAAARPRVGQVAGSPARLVLFFFFRGTGTCGCTA